MEMAKVKSCEVPECSYNSGKMCHALAITIGDEANPMCDTFCKSSTRGGNQNDIAGVGACKVEVCAHNHNLECSCANISVGYNKSEPDCLSFMAS